MREALPLGVFVLLVFILYMGLRDTPERTRLRARRQEKRRRLDAAWDAA